MRIDPDSEENQAATRQHEREVFALQMQAKQDAEMTDEKQDILDFFKKAVAYFQRHHRAKGVTAPRRPNRRTRPLIESERKELIRTLNIAVRLMDVPEARQDSAWWAERDEVLALWEKANTKERPFVRTIAARAEREAKP